MHVYFIRKFFFTILSLPMLTVEPYPDFRNKSLSEINDNKKWEIIAEARGELDQDDREDMAMVLQSKDLVAEKRCETCEIQSQKARILLVLLNNGSSLKVVAQNNHFIAREDEGGITKNLKPELSIQNKQLNLYYLFLRGETNYIFEVDNGSVVLVNATKLSASHYIYKSETVDFKKGTIVLESRSEKDDPGKMKTITVEKQTRKLSELGMMGTWEVGDGVFL